jgi:hypothetical protein
LATDGGIRVDEQLRTNLPGIYAAGDCATVIIPEEEGRNWLQVNVKKTFHNYVPEVAHMCLYFCDHYCIIVFVFLVHLSCLVLFLYFRCVYGVKLESLVFLLHVRC